LISLLNDLLRSTFTFVNSGPRKAFASNSSP
jgi:hypothetical protein